VPTLETLDGQTVETELPELAAGGDADQAPPPRPAGPPPPPATAPTAPRRRGRPPRAEQARVTPAASQALSDEARAAGVKGLTQIGAGLTLLLGKATGNDAYKADAVAIASVADDTAAACVQIAKTDPKFAAALDKVCSVGPYGALITIAAGLGAQIARDHKPDRSIPGTVHPDVLLQAQNEAEAHAHV
jgi:hypothetical protein